MLGAEGEREREARASAEAFVSAAARSEIVVHGFRDGYFPYVGAEVKDVFEEMKSRLDPDLIYSHGMTSTRITASSASSPGTRGEATGFSSTRSRSTTATSVRRTSSSPSPRSWRARRRK